MSLPKRLLCWVLGIWSPSLAASGEPCYYSFRGALRGERDLHEPPAWQKYPL